MAVSVFYIISGINKALAFEWIADTIDREKIDLKFIFLGKEESELVSFLTEKKITCFVIPFDGKEDFLSASWRVFVLLKKHKPNVVHCHLYYANLIGLSIAWLLRIPKRIYTRHHASIHHRYFPRAVYIDKVINYLATDIIVLSENLKKIVIEWEGADKRKVHLVPHGFDLKYFEANTPSIEHLRKKYLPGERFPVVGVIARHTEWKGVQYIIQAFSKLLQEFPRAHLILANAHLYF
jgi:glycosyltransferase involved in cell wall biosynthesis